LAYLDVYKELESDSVLTVVTVPFG